jgi:type IV secretory pathway VirB3-like protein
MGAMEVLAIVVFLVLFGIAVLALVAAQIFDVIVTSWNQNPIITIIAAILIITAVIFLKKVKDYFY